MITLAGHIPGEEIPIVFTGLRPGEKLNEQVLTEEEESSLVVRDRIRVAQGPPPPPDLADRLEELRQLAEEGEREAILCALQRLVPTYRPEGGRLLAAGEVGRRAGAVELDGSARPPTRAAAWPLPI